MSEMFIKLIDIYKKIRKQMPPPTKREKHKYSKKDRKRLKAIKEDE